MDIKPTKSPSHPQIFDLSEAADRAKFKRISYVHVVDEFRAQLRELFTIQNPELMYDAMLEQKFEKSLPKKPLWQMGKWVFFPWNSTVVHILVKKDFHTVRTARNRNLITAQEQRVLSQSTVGIVGLSIGSSVALALALQGVGKRIKLADNDSLDLSNLNRVPAGIRALGVPKVELAARMTYEIDPYARVELFPDGLTEANMKQFFKDLDVMVDESDTFSIKQLLRERAREARIPVISGADVGERAVVSVERYDKDQKTRPFHGKISLSKDEMSKLDKRAIGRLIAGSVGLEHHSTRMLTWPKELGKKGGVVSFPQLGGSALLNGSTVAFCVRHVLLGSAVINGSRCVALDHSFIEPSHFEREAAIHKKALGEFTELFGL